MKNKKVLAMIMSLVLLTGNIGMVQAQTVSSSDLIIDEQTDEQSGAESTVTGGDIPDTGVSGGDAGNYLPGGVENPDEYYDIWWDFEKGVWANKAIGASIIQEGGTETADLSSEKASASDSYMNVKGAYSGKYRVSRYDVGGKTCASTTVTFDWMPKSIQNNGSRFGDVSFYSSGSEYAFFGLQFDKDMKIKFYTIGENIGEGWEISYSEEELENGLKRNAAFDSGTAGDTGITADGNTWYTVKIFFDHLKHTASLSIADRTNPQAASFVKENIPIYASAANLDFVGAGGWKAEMEMGIDNFGVKFDEEIPPSYYYTTYWNDFEESVWENIPIGNTVIAEGGTSGATLSQKAEEENHFMNVAGNKNGAFRVSKLPVSDEAAEKAEVTFDFRPVSADPSDSRFGDISFYTTGNSYAYFGLQFDRNMAVKYYTVGENIEEDYIVTHSEEILENGIVRNSGVNDGNAADTGIVADGKTWYTIGLTFDYNQHTADLSIKERGTDTVLYEESEIPIYASAMNISSMAAGSWKGITEMDIDNLGIKYFYSDSNTIVSVKQPENVTVLAKEWDEHVAERPDKAEVTMGDGRILELKIGEWSSEPEFQPEVYGKYVWTAPLVLPEGIRNPKNLGLTYTVNYVENYTVEGAYDPATLELAFGSVASVEEFEAMRPKETQVVLSNGEVAYAQLDDSSWEAIVAPVPEGSVDEDLIPDTAAEFDPSKEGIYVYRAKLAKDGTYTVEDDIFVQWRVNYYSTDDNLNGYARGVENLGRGLYAVKNTVFDAASGTYADSAQGGIYLSWRMLVDEYEQVSAGNDMVFEIYRNNDLIATLNNITNYLDEEGQVGDVYKIKAIQNQIYSYSEEAIALEDNYISIHLQRPLPNYSVTDNLAVYRLNDTEVADVDGDNEYEVIVKWYPTNGFDPGKSSSNRTSSPHIIDVYEMDGTALWRLFMGYSSPSGQHFDNFMVYDLDNDGLAELSILTQDGTRTYRPDENGQFAYVTTEQGGYVFEADNPNHSESTGSYVLSEDGKGYVLSNSEGYDFAYVGTKGSPMMDDAYLIDVVGDINREGVGIQNNGFKSEEVEEYFTVFNGATGEIIDTVDYYYSTEFFMNETENTKTETVHRFNIGILTIPKDLSNPDCMETIPAVDCNRAYYSDMSHIAYTLVDGKIEVAWQTYIDNASQGGGNHNLATGDVDNDGFDEIYMGGTTIDHDGTVLWAKDGQGNRDFMKHGDMIHMTAVFPDSNQLYVFTPVEDGSVSTIINYALTNGANGGRIVGHGFGKGDTGRGMLANVTPEAGYNLWASTGGTDVNGKLTSALYNAYGEVVSTNRPKVQTWSSYWDGDLLSELPDSNPAGGGDKSGLPMGVHKYNWETGETDLIASFEGTWTNNSTKNNPSLVADIVGDWREEILVRSDNNEELRVYMTNIPTEYTIYTLMQDAVYRNSVANQNTTYNQPTHTGFYLGEDEVGRKRVLNFDLPVSKYDYTTEMPKYTDVTFVSNGGTQLEALNDVQLGKTFSAPENVIKEGYTLEGWYTDKACTAAWNFATDAVNGPLTLYAKWVADEGDREEEEGNGEDNSGEHDDNNESGGNDSNNPENGGNEENDSENVNNENTSDASQNTAKTGDESVHWIVWSVMFILAAGVAVYAVKRKEKEEKFHKKK